MEIMLESMMVAERGEILRVQEDRNKGNGFRLGHTYGHGRRLEFKIPCDRYGNFHPKILAVLRDQEEECERLAGSLYTKGLTQSQVGQVFDEIYGEHYSKSSISMVAPFFRVHLIRFQNPKISILSEFKKTLSAFYRNSDTFTIFASNI